MPQRIDIAGLARRLLSDGYTTARLGAEIGLSQPSVSRLATGRTRSISIDVGIKLINLAGGSVVLPPVPSSAVEAEKQQ